MCVMDTRCELQYKAVAEFKWSFFLFTSNFRLSLMAARLTEATWSELSDKCTTAFYVYCNGRRNCRRWCETKASRETMIFQNIIRHSFKFPEAWVATSRLDHRLLAWRGWWLVTVKEKKDFVPSHNNCVEPHDLLDEFPQLIV